MANALVHEGGFTGDVHSVSRGENQCWAGGGGRGPRAWKTSNKGLLRDGAGMWGIAGRDGGETGLRHRFGCGGGGWCSMASVQGRQGMEKIKLQLCGMQEEMRAVMGERAEGPGMARCVQPSAQKALGPHRWEAKDAGLLACMGALGTGRLRQGGQIAP